MLVSRSRSTLAGACSVPSGPPGEVGPFAEADSASASASPPAELIVSASWPALPGVKLGRSSGSRVAPGSLPRGLCPPAGSWPCCSSRGNWVLSSCLRACAEPFSWPRSSSSWMTSLRPPELAALRSVSPLLSSPVVGPEPSSGPALPGLVGGDCASCARCSSSAYLSWTAATTMPSSTPPLSRGQRLDTAPLSSEARVTPM